MRLPDRDCHGSNDLERELTELLDPPNPADRIRTAQIGAYSEPNLECRPSVEPAEPDHNHIIHGVQHVLDHKDDQPWQT